VRRRSAAPIPLPGSTPATDTSARALVALREVAHAVLTAERVEEALQFTLERVSPVVNATFASVFLLEGEGDVMRLAAAFNWPERVRPWLSGLRVRLGMGPSGEAASERRAIEVSDIFADPALGDWQDVAQELGFSALIALPLAAGSRVLGAATFYFAESGGFTASQRDLLRVAADQMSLAALHGGISDNAQRASSRLADAETEVRRQTVAALEAARARDEFLANVSHELKTPLTVVLGTIDLLTEELGGPLTTAQQTDLERAREASERLLGLVETLLALAALRKGTLAIDLEDFDPRAPLRDAAGTAGIPSPGVEFALEEPQTLIPSMRGDREKTGRILSSLIANAFKFTREGKIVASVEVAGGRVRYRVRDTGTGIPEAAQPFVFEEFRQADGSATREFGGAGLGLPLARGLARFLEGDIEMISVHGEGSTFTVELPLELHDLNAQETRNRT
jgi:signal transduction histidine kinase